jgi:spore maturation protein CgeB
MKILLVGADHEAAIERFYIQYMRALGAEVHVFAANRRFADWYGGSLTRKVRFRLGLTLIYRRINAEFRRVVKAQRPDLIWVFKGMEIYPSSLRWARKRRITMANYNPDNPFVFSGRGSGNANVTRSLGLYDLQLTYDLGTQRELERLYPDVPVFYLPFGYEVDDALYRSLEGEPEVLRACFLGTPDAHRAAFLNALSERGVPLDVYGVGWDAYVKDPGIRVHGPVYDQDFWRCLRKYRVQINLMRPHNPSSHNMRTFEVPGVGGIALMFDTPEHRGFFVEGKEAFFFQDLDDCELKARAILSMSPAQASRVREQARARSITSGYSYEARATSALTFFTQHVKS